MLSKYKYDIYKIEQLEEYILQMEIHTTIRLSVLLQELRNMRIDLYTNLSNEAIFSDELRRKMFDEYHEYCIFNTALTKKTIIKAIFDKTLCTFVDDYKFIEPYDNKQQAYKSTVSALYFVKLRLERNPSENINQINDVNRVITLFTNKGSDLERE